MKRFPPFLLLPLLLAAAAPVPAGETPRLAAAPSWVRDHDYRAAIPAAPAPLEILLADDQLRLDGDRTAFHRRVLRPWTPGAVEEASTLALRFNPAYQTLTLHRLLVRRGDTILDLTGRTTLRVVRAEEDGEPGEAVATARLEDLRAGDILDYRYSLSGRNPAFGDHDAGLLPLDGPSTINHQEIRLLAPAGRPLSVRATPGSDVRVTRQTRPDGLTEYRVRREGVAAVPPEPGVPPWRSPLAELEYSDFADWAAVEAWARARFRQPAPTSPRLQALLAQLGEAPPADFAVRGLLAVQNGIRSPGPENGADSPRPPEEVLRRGQGDARDKALLLATLLRARQISAWPALVSRRLGPGLGERLPSPLLLDHALVLAEVDGRRYWLDPSRRYQAGTLATLGRPEQAMALVLGHPDPGPALLYDRLAVQPAISAEQHYHSEDFSGPARLDTVTVFLGAAAERERERFASRPAAEIREAWRAHSAGRLGDLEERAPLTWEDDPQGNRFIVRASYRVPRFWIPGEREGRPVLQAPLDLPHILDLLPVFAPGERRHPWGLPSPRLLSNRLYIHLPSRIDLTVTGEPLLTVNPAFTLTGMERLDGKTYYLQSELVIRATEVAAEDWDAFRRDVNEARRQAGFDLVIPDPARNGLPEIRRLREAARQWSQP